MPTGLLVALILAIASIVATAGVSAYVFFTAGFPGFGIPAASITVTGHIFGGANEAVLVVYGTAHMQGGSGGEKQATLDAGGFYSFAAVPGASYTFWATLGVHWGLAMGAATTKTMPTQPQVVYLDLDVPVSDISGTITNASTGLPITGATMSIADPSGDWWCCQYTGADGRYQLWTITPGPYNLSVSAGGFSGASTIVSVPSMYASEVHDFPLAPGPAAFVPAVAILTPAAPPVPLEAAPAELTLFKVAS